MKQRRRNDSSKKQGQMPRGHISSKSKNNNNNNNRININDFTVQDLLKGKHLEIVTAALLLTGRLKVDSVQLFRQSPIVAVYLLGQFKTKSNGKSDALADFLKENGDMTVDDIIQAFQKRMNGRGR